MNLKTLVKNYLESQSLFRERKNKDRGIVNLLIDRYELKDIPKNRLISCVQDYASMDRMWRQILKENPNLRGSDYKDKDELEEKTLSELGYSTKENQQKLL